jgi:NAD-dependent deacetylase
MSPAPENKTEMDRAVDKAAEMLRRARHAVAFTGAGISTPSGIPDFRSQGSGIWERYNPMEVASVAVFQSHPERFYDWVKPLMQGLWAAQPNPAHVALAQMETAGVLKAVITQNIDDLHQRAGSKNVFEVHGSLRTVSCARCRQTYPSDQFRETFETAANATEGMPRCPACGKVLKPDITLFGEMLPAQAWREAEAHCQQADLVLVAGSSLEVWPAAALPEIALENGAHLILNNLSPTPLDRRADVLLRADVAWALPAVAERLRGEV